MKPQIMWAVSCRDNLSVTTIRRLRATAISDFYTTWNHWTAKFKEAVKSGQIEVKRVLVLDAAQYDAVKKKGPVCEIAKGAAALAVGIRAYKKHFGGDPDKDPDKVSGLEKGGQV